MRLEDQYLMRAPLASFAAFDWSISSAVPGAGFCCAAQPDRFVRTYVYASCRYFSRSTCAPTHPERFVHRCLLSIEFRRSSRSKHLALRGKQQPWLYFAVFALLWQQQLILRMRSCSFLVWTTYWPAGSTSVWLMQLPMTFSRPGMHSHYGCFTLYLLSFLYLSPLSIPLNLHCESSPTGVRSVLEVGLPQKVHRTTPPPTNVPHVSGVSYYI